MKITMRPATEADMQAVYAILSGAIDHMNANGIPQWDERYPTPADADGNLQNGELYVAEAENGAVVATVALNQQCDPEYRTTAWQGGEPWVVVHRLCVAPEAQGQGVGRGLMLAVEDWARANGYADIRLDAFSRNPHALRMYDKLGYVKRGEATWRKGLFYLMEKRL